ncbi:MAG: hypothetical protein KGL39_15345 [Patescibacteria group bacterium]|nr:hypothetical protein [Patescibacteria group bacterium]
MRRLIFGALTCAYLGIVAAASGITYNGTDLDSLFAPLHAGWPQAAATGITVSGSDLNTRYAPISTGMAAAAVPVTIHGTNLNAIFAGYGTTGLSISLQPGAVSGSAAAGNPSGSVTSSSTSCAAIHGNSGAYSYSWHIATGSASPTAASSSTSAVTGTVNAGATITGTWYCTISDGVTSANTSTVAWSLQNTTPANWTFTITSGQFSSGGNTNTGYDQGSIGTISGGTQGPLTITVAMDTVSIASYTSLTISGFSADPGRAYFVSMAANGVTLLSSSATYGYGSGVANWAWNGSTFGYPNGSPTTVVITF